LVPPFYSDNEFEVIGVPKVKNGKEIDLDSGRAATAHNPIYMHAFKTVGIRNIDKTAPYMHNGVFNTIDEVLDFYNKGGGAGLGIDIPNQTLPFDSLQLNKEELNNLKKFILSLTDKEFNIKAPTKLPIVSIKGLEKRKVGGEY
jgi:cytochrome c peroxidase